MPTEQDIFKMYRGHILKTAQTLQLDGPFEKITSEPPRDPRHGHIATNAALVLAKPARKNPRELAKDLAQQLDKTPEIAQAQVAGPGFINLFLSQHVWHQHLSCILQMNEHYGKLKPRKDKVLVEYVSANPTGPLHVGHMRGAVFGDALARLLQTAGFIVAREYYWNDTGEQMKNLVESVHQRHRQAQGEDIDETTLPYPGTYLKKVAQQIGPGDKPGDKEAIRRKMQELIATDLRQLGNLEQTHVFESKLIEHKDVETTVKVLAEKGYVYEGALPPPKGKRPENWQPRHQRLFRATQFGDDIDRPLQKEDGSWTYFATDMAYHRDKFRRGFREMINVWGADHGGYIKRLQGAVAAVTDGQATLDIKLCQMVHLLRDGVPVKMSKRQGDYVTVGEVVEEVGRDAARFMMLFRKNDAPLEFDFTRVQQESRDNPVYYVQYAHARLCSLLRQGQGYEQDGDLSLLTHEAELGLIRHLALFPRTVEAAALAHEPHRIAFYLHDLAACFHGLWSQGNKDPALRFLVADNKALTMARLQMIRATQQVFASGLGILGIEPRQELR